MNIGNEVIGTVLGDFGADLTLNDHINGTIDGIDHSLDAVITRVGKHALGKLFEQNGFKGNLANLTNNLAIYSIYTVTKKRS